MTSLSQPEVYEEALSAQVGISDKRLLYLEKILNSQIFRRSNRIRRFLRYLVTRSLNAAADSPKEYALGLEVFDRGTDYDPRLDPIVRVEARRLRAKLAKYYETEGTLDGLRIFMPSRGYKLEFLGNVDPPEPIIPVSRPAANTGLLAVLPLVSVDQDAKSRLFAEGLTDELAFQLSARARLNVLARTSTFQFRDRCGDIREIGAELGADHILEGSLRREGRWARVLVQVVHVSSGIRLWSGDYEQKILSVLAAQKSIAERIVTDITPALHEALPPLPARSSRSEIGTVFTLCEKGRRYLDSRTEQGIRTSIECFQQAIAADSRSALAYAGLADGYSLAARYEVFPLQESWMKARSAAIDAIRIDGTLAEAHAALAFIQLHHTRDWPSAEREFRAAIQLNPNYAPARRWYGWCLAASGRADLAIVSFRRALELDPLSPNANADLALALYFSRDYHACIAQCERTLALTPDFYRAHQLLGLSHLQTGNWKEAIARFHAAIDAAGRNKRMLALMAHAYAAMGDRSGVAQLCSEIEAGAPGKVSAMDLCLLYSATGDLDRAFEHLERAFCEGSGELIWLSVDPIYEILRRDPRFVTFSERIPVTSRHQAEADTLP
jgi:TolB-like protein/Tfp pilus assembly protein PilF